MYATLRKAPALWYALALPVMAWLPVVCLMDNGSAPAAVALAITGAALLMAFLLWPMLWHGDAPEFPDLVRWLLLIPSTAIPLLITVPAASWLSLTLPLLAGLLLLALFLGALTLSFQRIRHLHGVGAHRGVVTLLLLAMSAPLWLGPLAAQLDQPAFTNLVVAASPMSYLSALIEVDLYRTAWFYAHTSLGGLRYDDPDLTALTLFYAATAALLPALSGRLALRRGRTQDTHNFHSLNEEPTP